MNRQFRIVALLIALVSAWPICHAQQTHTISFSYDFDGNRTNREILFGRLERTGEANEELLPFATDSFETIEVNLYPNPTNDKFFVEFKGDTNERLEATLTHISGAILEKRILTDNRELFDLSGLAPGIYILNLTVDNETHAWKVIKKQ